MKTFLNWIMLFCMVFGALGVSPLAQDVAVIAQAEQPPVVGESQEPLILPFVPDETAESALQLPLVDPGITEPPAPAPFSIQLDTYCDAWGQTARLSWSLTGELADSLGDRSELLVKLPVGLLPLEGMEIAPDGFLHLPASLEGQAVFDIQSEANETDWLDARLTTADAEQAATRVEFTPGAYARLTAEGGRVEAKAMGISVEIPEKVLLAETAICIGPVTEVELPTSLSGRPFQLNAYDVEKGEEITKFEQDLKVQVSYGEERYSGIESQLMLFYYNRELLDWAALPTEVDEESNTLTGYTSHFTPFDFKTQSWESARLPTLDGFAVSNFTGAATYSYPIQLPPGAGGWQPSLALTYNSQVVDNANSMTQSSWAGMGWSLDTGYIQRNMGDRVDFYGLLDGNDTDTGRDGDDTFSLVLNGQSWRLLRLPDQDSNTETIEYRTENESFWRIRRNHAHINAGYVTDNSTWEVWDKTGNKYTFSPLARYPIGCNSPFMLVWQWPLTLAQTAMDLENPNVDYSITYTYAFDQEARRNGVGCDGAFTQVAVYPATISYSGYQVVFDRSARYDHKAAWDTYPDKEYQSIFFEQSRLAAIRVLSQNGSNLELVRKYTLGYQDGLIFPSLIWDANVPGSKTPTLTSITEYGSDGTSPLPATTFSYTDGMHLVTGSNGYGASVTFDYEGTSDNPWYEFVPTQDPISEFAEDDRQLPTTGYLGGRLDIYDPGQVYKIEIIVLPATVECQAGYNDGVNNHPAILVESGLQQNVYRYFRWASKVSSDSGKPSFYFSCSSTVGATKVDWIGGTLWPLVNRYRVTAKIVSESQNNTSSTTSYTYTGASTNNPTLSPGAGTYPYTELRTEYRGNNSMTQIAPQGLATTSWFGQKDDYSGLSLAQMTALQQVYDDFDTLDTGVWSYSHYGTRQVIVKEEGEPLLKMENPNADWSTLMARGQPTLQDSESAVIQFKLSGDDAEAILALSTPSNPLYRWGIVIQQDPASTKHQVSFESIINNVSQPLHLMIDYDTFVNNSWYVLMLTAGEEQFTARIWQRDNPAAFYQYSVPRSLDTDWQFLQYIKYGTLYLDDYREGPVYGLQLTNHGVFGTYTPPTIVPPYEYPGNNAHTDMGINWIVPLQTISFSLGESGQFTGTRQEYQYDPARQGNAQYGNLTNQIESYWTGSVWFPYRMTLTGYYPNSVNTPISVKNLVGLPGFTNQYKCENDSACIATNARLLSSLWYLYDSNTMYNVAPTVGVLAGKRNLLFFNVLPTSDPRYLDENYTYDSWGNLATTISYATPGTYATRSTSGPRKSETIYDTQHHAYPLETRAYYNTNQYYSTFYSYDNNDGNIRMGLLTRLTDPNNAITTAGYDVFGRITSIVRPGDSTGTPTMRFTYNQTSSLFWTQAEQLISGSTYYKTRRFYNGLGQLIQTQEDATVGGSLQTVVTDTMYNALGLVEKQSAPFSVVLRSVYLELADPYPNPVTQTTFDPLGRVNTISQPDGTTIVKNYHIYLLGGQPTSVTYTEDANGNISEAWADTFGRLVRSQGAAGPAVSYTYDPADHLTTALYGNALTSLSYDIAGRKLTLDDPDMGLWSYAYDALGSLTRQTDARGQRICLYYDPLNRLLGKHYRTDDACPTSPTYNVSYGYDSGTNGIGQRTSMTDTSGSTSWTYTSRGLLETENKTISGAGTFATKYTYNSADLPTNMQYPADNANNLTALPSLTYTYHPQMALDTLGSYVTGTTYDAAGRITSRLLGSSGLRQDFAYTAWDAQFQGGKLDKIEAGTNAPDYNNLQNLDYGYDKVGNILTILDATNSSQKQCFTYDALNRLTRGTTTNDSDPAKQCGTTQLGNGNYDQSTTYDAATGNLGSKAGVGYTYGDTNHDHAVTRVDDDSPATSKTITIRAKKINNSGVTTHPIMNLYVDGQQVVSFSVSRTYYYNYSKTITISNNEQIDVVCSNCSSSIQLDIDYVNVGFQSVQTEGAATLLDEGMGTYAFDWQNVSKPTTSIIEEPAALRFVVGNNAFSGAYDANGNLIYRLVNGLATIMTYDAENRLTNVTGTPSATFVYDGDGNRVKSTINTTIPVTTAFIGNHTEWDVSSSSLTRYYYAGSSRVAMRKNNTVYYLLSDHLGSTSLTTDQNGQNPVKQYYLPWGEVRYTDGTLQTKYTYTGQYSNVPDFGLMYYNARWYDPLLSRFSSADTIIPQPGNPLDWDRYSYVRNNPINYSDPSGHRACDSTKECEAEGITPNGKTTKKFLMNLMTKEYGWNFDGVFNYNEIAEIYQASQDIQGYVNGITNGGGSIWMKKYMNGVTFTHGGLFGYSVTTGNTIHLVKGWEKTAHAPHITHELTHVWDNHSAIEFGFTHEALWYGGGNADLLIILLGGIPFGLRWTNGSGDFLGLGGVPKEYQWGEGYYGNHSTADYMADSFEYMVYPSLGKLPKDKNGWGPEEILNAFIVAESSLLP